MASCQKSAFTNNTRLLTYRETNNTDSICKSKNRLWFGLLHMVITCTGWFLMHDLKTMDKIGHAEIRNILLKHVTRWMKFKTVLSKSNGPNTL